MQARESEIIINDLRSLTMDFVNENNRGFTII